MKRRNIIILIILLLLLLCSLSTWLFLRSRNGDNGKDPVEIQEPVPTTPQNGGTTVPTPTNPPANGNDQQGKPGEEDKTDADDKKEDAETTVPGSSGGQSGGSGSGSDAPQDDPSGQSEDNETGMVTDF